MEDAYLNVGISRLPSCRLGWEDKIKCIGIYPEQGRSRVTSHHVQQATALTVLLRDKNMTS